MKAELYADKHYYDKPDALPAGFLEIIQPIAGWFFAELVKAYDNGYSAGRNDEVLVQMKSIDVTKLGKKSSALHH